MTTIIVSLLCKFDAIEHIRAAVRAAEEYERESAPRPSSGIQPECATIGL
ncbi:hypothetical protein QTL95_24770 [Rhizobium sp. S152]|nr:hypothetical protein [Rhizobium sp. S152]MDM9629107.1 hypothetical protein [Rhizobium sp. S152]